MKYWSKIGWITTEFGPWKGRENGGDKDLQGMPLQIPRLVSKWITRIGFGPEIVQRALITRLSTWKAKNYTRNKSEDDVIIQNYNSRAELEP